MKRTLIALAAIATVPLAGATVALAQVDGGAAAKAPHGLTTTPGTSRSVVVQAGATRKVVLGKVNGGTGYAWKWITRPQATVAKGYPVQLTRPTKAMPGAPRTAYVRILGLAEDQTTTGTLGLFAPGDQTTPTKTVNLKITVTGDGR